MAVRAAYITPALEDLSASLRLWRNWWTLGWYDFWFKHTRTLIGPFWQTVQVAIWVLGLTLIFRRGEGNHPHYVAYVALGVIFWNFISGTITASVNVFNRSSNLILNVNNPLLFYCFRQHTHHLARLLFQFLLYLGILVFTLDLITPATLMVIPGLLAILLTAVWVGPLLGILGSRYGDTEQIAQTLMRFFFFASPVFWVAKGDGIRQHIALYNPFTHFLEIVRAPLLGDLPSVTSWCVVLGIFAVGSIGTVAAFSRYRRVLVFWL